METQTSNATPKSDIAHLNSFLRGEISAVETYNQAIEKLARAPLESKIVTLYSGWKGETLLGWAYIDVHTVRTLPEAFLVVLDPQGAVRSLRYRALNMSVLVATGVLAAYLFSVVITIADEGAEMQSGMDRLIAALAPRTENVCYAPRPKSTHGTIYHDVSPEALQYLFPTDVAHEPETGFVIACSKKS